MDLIKSWAVSAGVLLVGTVVSFVVVLLAVSAASLDGGVGLLVWSGVPVAVVYGLAAFAGAAVHARPARARTGRHIVAVVVPPVAFLVISVLVSAADAGAGALVVTLAGAGTGTAAGWALGDLVRRPRGRNGYFGA